jgi:sterol desaturase/sphingolipid hydroxylase (fatty acid hydroxylase superfamily)
VEVIFNLEFLDKWVNYLFHFSSFERVIWQIKGEQWYLAFIALIILLEILFKSKSNSFQILFDRSTTSRWDAISSILYLLNLRKNLSNIFTLGLLAYLLEFSGSLTRPLLTDLPNWIRWPLVFILYDFLTYWNHRFKHTSKILWKTHEFHHSSEKINLFTSYRIHPLDFLVYFSIVLFPMSHFFYGVADTAVFMFVYSIISIFNHSRLDLGYGWFGRWILVSPRYHHLHHGKTYQQQMGNFSKNLVIWDRLFATYIEPNQSIDNIQCGLDLNPYTGKSPWKPFFTTVISFYKLIWESVVRHLKILRLNS